MGKHTNIPYVHHSVNRWIGCTPVGPGCDNCFARAIDRRTGGDHWGPGKPRRRTSDTYWEDIRRWNRRCERLGIRERILCPTMSDWADNEVPDEWRMELFAMIRETPNLDWLLITKRVSNIPRMLPPDWGSGYPNVWLLLTVCNQPEANRDIPRFLRIPAVIHGLSVEPLLGPLNLRDILLPDGGRIDALRGIDTAHQCHYTGKLDLIIVGYESGPGARTGDLQWARDLRDQARAAGTDFYMKQMPCTYSKTPADFDTFPEDLKIREIPDRRQERNA